MYCLRHQHRCQSWSCCWCRGLGMQSKRSAAIFHNYFSMSAERWEVVEWGEGSGTAGQRDCEVRDQKQGIQSDRRMDAAAQTEASYRPLNVCHQLAAFTHSHMTPRSVCWSKAGKTNKKLNLSRNLSKYLHATCGDWGDSSHQLTVARRFGSGTWLLFGLHGRLLLLPCGLVIDAIEAGSSCSVSKRT